TIGIVLRLLFAVVIHRPYGNLLAKLDPRVLPSRRSRCCLLGRLGRRLLGRNLLGRDGRNRSGDASPQDQRHDASATSSIDARAPRGGGFLSLVPRFPARATAGDPRLCGRGYQARESTAAGLTMSGLRIGLRQGRGRRTACRGLWPVGGPVGGASGW